MNLSIKPGKIDAIAPTETKKQLTQSTIKLVLFVNFIGYGMTDNNKKHIMDKLLFQ